jgi:hypothetical protein
MPTTQIGWVMVSFDAPPAELLLDFDFTDDQQPENGLKRQSESTSS